jgi:hypothetical protein
MTFVFSIFFIILNGCIYKLLSYSKSFKQHILIIPVFFVFMIIITKIYNKFRLNNMPEGLALFILLGFSFGIIILNFIKKIIKMKVNIAETLDTNNILPINLYLKIVTVVITIFQLFLILSKTIYIFKD